jgi:hypothetical protein
MDEKSDFELSSVVCKDLLSFNDAKTPVSLDEFDVLLQIVCDTLINIPSTNLSNSVINQLEGNIQILHNYEQELIYFL